MVVSVTQKNPSSTKLYLGDCLDVMPSIKDKSIDAIICDLPFGITQNSWDIVIPFEDLWPHYERIIKDSGVIILNAVQPFSSALVMSNPKLFRYEWVWVKSKITGVLNAKIMPVRKHETILIFYKNQPTYNAQGLTLKNTETKQGGCSTNYGARNEESYIQEYENWPRDVLEIPSEGSLTHPTQKPVALCEYLIKTYTNKGDLILDNCMGTGTTGVAARKLGRDFIGIEKVADFFEISKFRIEPNILKHADIVYIV